jgi:hypothetical protein
MGLKRLGTEGRYYLGYWLAVSLPCLPQFLAGMKLKREGILRSIIKPSSRSDEDVDIQRLTNEVIMPLVNSLLDLDLAGVTSRVSQLATEAVSLGSLPGTKPH